MKQSFWENCNVTKIEVACFVPPKTGSAVHKHRTSHGLAMILEGKKEYVFDGEKSLIADKNQIIYLPKGATYRVNDHAPGSVYCINFQLSPNANLPPFVQTIHNTEFLINAYREAEKAWQQQRAGCMLKCKAELYKIIYELYKELQSPYYPKHKVETIRPALDYIHKHYHEEQINTQKLSGLCGVSYEYLRKLFRNCCGCAPIDYVNNLRLKRAKELLSSGLYTVSEAAIQAGFNDMAYFSRLFKREVGVPPSQYH